MKTKTKTNRYKCEDFIWDLIKQEKSEMGKSEKDILLSHFIKYEEYETCSLILKYYENKC